MEDLSLFRSPAFHAITTALTPRASPRIEKTLKELAEWIAQDPEMGAAADLIAPLLGESEQNPAQIVISELR